MAWTCLAVAAVIEVIWAASLKASDGFTRPPYIAVMLVSMLATSWLLAMATRSLPLGLAYTVWTGAGIVGSLLVGCLVYGETLGVVRLAAIAMIAGGVVVLKVAPA
jgi:quaternary ammonium compound-resistance protein SugE